MNKHNHGYKIGDMYAPKSIFLAMGQMASSVDPIKRVYEAMRKNPADFNAPRKISMVMDDRLFLEGIPTAITFNDMKGLFNSVFIAPVQDIPTESYFVAEPETNSIVLSEFFKVAHQVKKRTKSDVVHHLAAEVGEISECLVQPQRGGNIVEESIDAIVCALDVIYLELHQTHGTVEIAEVMNKVFAKKLEKWYATCS